MFNGFSLIFGWIGCLLLFCLLWSELFLLQKQINKGLQRENISSNKIALAVLTFLCFIAHIAMKGY